MKIAIPASVGRFATKCLAGVKKASPEIALTVGLVGTVGTMIFACRQTTKLDAKLHPHKTDIDLIHSKKIDEQYTEKDKKKDITHVYFHVAWDMTKLYGPVLLAEAASLGLVLLSHRQLKIRNASLSVALSSVTAAFNEYRNRVKAELGADADKRFRYGIKAKEAILTDENGEEITAPVEVAETFSKDIYKRYFNEHYTRLSQRTQKRRADGVQEFDSYGNPIYIQDIEMDMHWIKCHEAIWNDIKNSRKNRKVYFNEVLRDLGFDDEDYGQDVGWFGEDSVIDFRPTIVTMLDEAGRPYATIALDFNCDGCIRDEVVKPKKRKVIAKARKVAIA